ncbi:hypothetical protein CEXT_96101 [Caerostris extrusa]|uniref:Uncharacterized protein n=1 Tax=Caerostris extrusa TaxID=172846 RepID=A0AAV4W450_CAEEX|nr:hypothetical protein CEXT_96101 [Caerostris extrusa]
MTHLGKVFSYSKSPTTSSSLSLTCCISSSISLQKLTSSKNFYQPFLFPFPHQQAQQKERVYREGGRKGALQQTTYYYYCRRRESSGNRNQESS